MKKNLQYHPIRYEFQLRPILNAIEKACVEARGNYDGLEKDEFRESLFSEAIKNYAGYEVPYYGLAPEFSSGEGVWISERIHAFGAYDWFSSGGKNIFHLGPELISLLKKTEVTEVDLRTLRFPFQTFYLYFGGDENYQLGKHNYIDGTYVCLIHEGGSKPFSGLAIRMTSAFKETDYSIRSDDFLKIDDQIPAHLIHNQKLLVPYITDEKMQKQMDEIKNLIINALCFLSSKHNDAELSFDPDTPKSIVDKFNQAKTPKLKKRIESKAKSQGYNRINFVGNSFKNANTPDSNKSGISPSSHWRRGHWRNQAFGKSHHMHKLVWIMPTLINKDKGPAKTGHIYNV